MKTRSSLGIAAVAALLTSTPVLAQNIYAELSGGASRVSADCAGTSSCDRDGRFVRAIFGYELTPQWAVEVSVADLGRIQAAGFVPGVGTVRTSAKLRSAGVGVAGTLPLSDNFSLIGRVGVVSNQVSVSGSAGGISVNDSERNTAATAGLALNYAWSKTTSVGLSLDRTDAEYGGTKNAVAALGIGVRVRF